MTNHSRRRRSAWGSVTEVERGRVYRLRYLADLGDGYRRHSETVRGTRRQAADRLAALQVEHTADAPAPTVGYVWDTWMLPGVESRVASGDLSRSTQMQYACMWRRHIAPKWESVQVTDVHPLAVQEWLDGMRSSSANASVHIFRQTMDYAVRYELVTSNPLSLRYRMPSPSTSRSLDSGVWTLDELCEIATRLHGEWLEAAFILSAFGSCRVGESLGPMASEVERTEVGGVTMAVVPIVRQVTNANVASDSLKNKWSRRSVVVPGAFGERLCELADASDGTWLTNDGCGRHARQDRLRMAWEGADLGDIDWHPFRQTRPSWQTYMRWTLSVPPWLIERMMGHVGDGVTGRHYDRPESQQFCDAIAEAYTWHPFGPICR